MPKNYDITVTTVTLAVILRNILWKGINFTMKTYYADYVGHMVRFYLSGRPAMTECDTKNHMCVGRVINQLPAEYRTIVTDFYANGKILNHSEWKHIKQFEKAVAKERGLV